MDYESFLATENAFSLPTQTMPALNNMRGTFSTETKHRSDGTIDRISADYCLEFKPQMYVTAYLLGTLGVILKAPQKIQVGAVLLSVTYNPETGLTTGILNGQGALHPVPGRSEHLPPIAYELLESLHQGSSHLFPHPLFLPVLVLQNHMQRSRAYEETLYEKVDIHEQTLGVTYAGRRAHGERTVREPAKRNVPTLLADLHSTIMEIIFFECIASWEGECASFLSSLLLESASRFPGMFGSSWDARTERSIDSFDARATTTELLEAVGYMKGSASGHVISVSSLKERVQLSINVLYNFTAQIDNRLNAKIAVSSGRDSAAMKLLAFVTAIFLPGSFIATMFSMSMFTWPEPAEGTAVSGSFWIFWIITIPLTVLVGVGWRIWFTWEFKRYQKELEEANNEEYFKDGKLDLKND